MVPRPPPWSPNKRISSRLANESEQSRTRPAGLPRPRWLSIKIKLAYGHTRVCRSGDENFRFAKAHAPKSEFKFSVREHLDCSRAGVHSPSAIPLTDGGGRTPRIELRLGRRSVALARLFFSLRPGAGRKKHFRIRSLASPPPGGRPPARSISSARQQAAALYPSSNASDRPRSSSPS